MPVVILFLLTQLALLCGAQEGVAPPPATPPAPEDFKVYSDHPRLLLPARRLRLLRRERERKTMRWEQFHSLISGKATMAEPGFALALHYAASEDEGSGKLAIEWALSRGTDLRQLALVYDWCFPALTESQNKTLVARITQALAREAKLNTIPAVRNRLFGAIAVADANPKLAEDTLRTFWQEWWVKTTAPALKANRLHLKMDDTYAFLEILHVVRDNLNFDMRDNALPFFKDFPFHHVLSYYPAPYPAAENLYRILVYEGLGQPDLDRAVQARATDLALVAFDGNAVEHQFVQGWVLQDPYLMRGAYGITYEFLWANPYQPGLSYHHLPLYLHDPQSGILLIRSSWDESATWLYYSASYIELFMDGKRSGLKPMALKHPLQIGDHLVMTGEPQMRWDLNLPSKTTYFVIALKPNTYYEIEVDDQEMFEQKADAGGILALTFPAAENVGVRVRESPYRGARGRNR